MRYDISLSYIALKYHMSESHLSTRIKKHLGQNFQSYVEPVSYTHLDVYKRQPSIWRCWDRTAGSMDSI